MMLGDPQCRQLDALAAQPDRERARRTGAGFAYSDLGNTLAADGTGSYSRLPGGELLGLTQNGTSALAYTDLVGTYTAAGAVSSSASYTPHGEVIGRTGATHALGYESGWTDPATGRVNRAARWYTPGTGTFTSRDDISGPSGPGHSAYNRYGYTAGNPLNLTDPTGHYGQCLIAAGAGRRCFPVPARSSPAVGVSRSPVSSFSVRSCSVPPRW
jgi:RHS repeat-associated protein